MQARGLPHLAGLAALVDLDLTEAFAIGKAPRAGQDTCAIVHVAALRGLRRLVLDRCSTAPLALLQLTRVTALAEFDLSSTRFQLWSPDVLVLQRRLPGLLIEVDAHDTSDDDAPSFHVASDEPQCRAAGALIQRDAARDR